MNLLRGTTRWLGAYVVAALVGYTIASVGITAHNLARLGALGIDIGAANAWDTVVFDFKALSPTFGTITKYGSVVWLGFLIAFGAAHVPLVSLSRLRRRTHFDLALFALAGATAMVVGIAIIDAQYKVSMISGTSGVSGYLAQLLAGVAAGVTFAACLRASDNAGARP
jgi:hypothetical protein